MAKRLVSASKLTAIGDAIRAKDGSSGLLTLDQMAVSIGGLGGIEVVDAGSGPIEVGYFMDEACTVAATVGLLIDMGSSARVYRKLIESASWSTGSDAEIQEMAAYAKAGSVDLTQYWSVGDMRTVSQSAKAATGVGESHVAQNVQVVLMHKNWKDAKGVTHPFLWGLKDGLANGTSGEYGHMNSSNTNSGGWNGCARRKWCNNVFFPALPAWLQEATGTTAVKTANGSSSSTVISSDRCFLPAEFEIFGTNIYANSSAESGLTHIEYYKTASNRIKKQGPSGSAYVWLERSPYSGNSGYFCLVGSSGTANFDGASGGRLLAPCGCIL